MISIEDFLARLENVTQNGEGRWMASCPAHDDSNPSMSVAIGDKGGILVKCFAGCPAESIVAAMGLKMSDLMPEEKNHIANPKKRKSTSGGGAGETSKGASPLPSFKAPKKERDYGKHVCYYNYQDETGAVIFRIDRRVKKNGKKDFYQQHPDPSSEFGWSYGVHRAGIQYVPYRLPKILAAAKAGKSVLICEGEKDVESIEKYLGVVATCNPGGAQCNPDGSGKWESGWGKYFEGVPRILIIADKDPETKKNKKTGEEEPFLVGQKHACVVEAKLRADGYKGEIRKVCLPDVRTADGQVLPVKDFTDWVEQTAKGNGTVDKAAFLAAIDEFGAWPDKWMFDEAALADRARAQKNARDSASSSPGTDGSSAEGEAQRDGDAPGERRHRFGVPVPRTPTGDVNAYEVDYWVDSYHSAHLTISSECSISQNIGRAVRKVREVCPKGEVPAWVSKDLNAFVPSVWLLARGTFFWNMNDRSFAGCMFLDRDPKCCRLMKLFSDEFRVFVGHHAVLQDVDEGSGELRKIFGYLKQIALSDEYSTGIVPSCMWDRRRTETSDAIYISSGDTSMYRLKDGKIELLQNGADNVVFLRGRTLMPWTLQEGPGLDPIAHAAVFRSASWGDRNGRMNVRLWLLNLFASHRMKPPMLITGPAGCGKTRLSLALKEILEMKCEEGIDTIVKSMEEGDKGEDAFWVSINNNKVVIFDNFDTKIKWAGNAIEIAATDGMTERRKKYSNDDLVVLRANGSLILTANNPQFVTEGQGGIPDRIITINLEFNRSTSEDEALSYDIHKGRNQFMTWIARTLAAALSDTKPVTDTVNRRHPEYGRFSIRCGRAFGDEDGVIAALGSTETEKALLPLRNDQIAKEVLAVLEGCDPPWTLKFTSGEMSEKIVARLGDASDDKTASIYSARRVGKVMSKYLKQFSAVLRMEKPSLIEGKTTYKVAGLTDAGRIVMLAAVGSVGLKADFSQTPEEGGVESLPANGTLNPPNPPFTRARDFISSNTRGEEKENNESEDLDDLSF